jgi:hypothetical protein
MAKELVKQGVPGRDGGGTGARRGRRAPVVALTPEQQWWLEAEVRPVVDQVAAELAGVGVGESARRYHQRWAWGLAFGLVVLVGLLGLGVLVGAWLAQSVGIGP